MQTEPSVRPIFDNFPRGKFRVNWLGAIWPSAKSDGGYEIDVQLLPLTIPVRAPSYVRVPLGALSLLVAGSEWEDGHFRRWASHDVADVDVHVGNFESEERAVSPYKLLDRGDYFLHRMSSPCYCRVLRTETGPDLLVPTWEILRTWYLFHPRVVSAVVGGGLRYPHTISASLLPWRPEGTGWPAGGMPHILRRKFISDRVAMRLGRLLFDPVAADRAYYIYRSLRSDEDAPSDRSRRVPPVLPPYEGVGRWRIWYRDLPETDTRPARRLVLRICSANLPLPYADIEVGSEADNAQGANKDDPNLPLAWTRASPEIILPKDGAVDLTGGGADSALAGVNVDRFDFADNAVHDVNLHRPVKLLQSYRHGGSVGEPVAVTKVSVDPTATRVPGQPAQGSGGGELDTDPARLPSTVSFADMQDVFGALINTLNGATSRLPSSWSASFYKEGGVCLRVRNSKRGESRLFLAVKISDGNRHLYMVEAERLRPSEKFSIFICEERHGLELNDNMMFNWLRGFPFKHGSHWMDPNYGGIALIPGTSIHQPHRPEQTADNWFRFYIDRLHEKVEAFVERRY